jgi:hypothetical protein
MLKRATLPFATIVTMTVVCQPIQAETPASKSVNQTKPEIQQLRSDVDKLTRENEDLRFEVSRLRSDVSEVSQLRSDVNSIRSNLADKGSVGLIAFYFGTVCALWAQNTRRNPWLWFFLGFFFNVITALFVLSKNSQDLNSNQRF